MKLNPSRMGFTLIELLVVVALLAILVLVVLMVIDPAARIDDSRDAKANSDVRNTASSVQSCIVVEMSKNPPVNPYDANTCAKKDYLTDNKFAENVPDGAELLVDSDRVCVYAEGRGGKYASWQSKTGKIISSPYGVATCH
ncbi:MAG TPA: prepilin-type N-terminal cleavage/methylation domain-containing protein [Candidatus Nanoarchaeia archaeon]